MIETDAEKSLTFLKASIHSVLRKFSKSLLIIAGNRLFIVMVKVVQASCVTPVDSSLINPYIKKPGGVGSDDCGGPPVSSPGLTRQLLCPQ